MKFIVEVIRTIQSTQTVEVDSPNAAQAVPDALAKADTMGLPAGVTTKFVSSVKQAVVSAKEPDVPKATEPQDKTKAQDPKAATSGPGREATAHDWWQYITDHVKPCDTEQGDVDLDVVSLRWRKNAERDPQVFMAMVEHTPALMKANLMDGKVHTAIDLQPVFGSMVGALSFIGLGKMLGLWEVISVGQQLQGVPPIISAILAAKGAVGFRVKTGTKQ